MKLQDQIQRNKGQPSRKVYTIPKTSSKRCRPVLFQHQVEGQQRQSQRSLRPIEKVLINPNRLKSFNDADREDGPDEVQVLHHATEIQMIKAIPPESPALNLLPIKASAVAHRAVHYYAEVYAPSILQRPQYAGTGTDWSLLKDLVPFTMQNQMVLNSQVALMELVQNKAQQASATAPPSKAVIRYSTEAMVQLQSRLTASNNVTDDDVILTILALAAIEFYNRNYRRSTVHMQALNRIVELRGGAEHLGFDGYLKHTFAAYQTYWLQRRADREVNPIPKSALEYPTHPFASEISLHASKIPPGFVKPVLDRHICIALIELIAKFQDIAQNRPDPAPSEGFGDAKASTAIRECSTKCIELLGYGVSPPEQLILLGLLAYLVYNDKPLHMYRLLNPYLQTHGSALLNADFATHDATLKDALVWASSCMVATMLDGSWAARIGYKVIGKTYSRDDVDGRIKANRTFYWDNGLSDLLRKKTVIEERPSILEESASWD